MNFELDRDFELFAEQLRRAFADRAPLADAHRCVDVMRSSDVARRVLVDLGATAAAIPEAFGGAGLGRVPLCVAALEVGYAVAAVPVFTDLYVATEALLEADAALKARWLPRVAAGESVISVCVDWAGSIAVDGDAGIDGAPTLVAGQANRLLILQHDKAVLVDIEGVSARERIGIDPARPHVELDLRGRRATPIGDDAAARRIADRTAIYLAFEAIGCGTRALETAIAYARERETFGRRVAGYQAIKHKLADIWVALELAHVHALYAAWASDTGSDDLPLAAAAAHVAALDACSLAAREGLQVHGGYGFTYEADCHLFYRRARSIAAALGGVGYWRRRLGRLLVDGARARH